MAIGPEYYDQVFSTSTEWAKDCVEAPWSHLWRWISEQHLQPSIIDLGCGPGHLADLLSRENRLESYLGLDFSPVAIRLAQERKTDAVFVCVEITPDLVKRVVTTPNEVTVVACEFLEHVDDDIGILDALPSTTRIVFTVPDYSSKSHVRHFPSAEFVSDRYEHLLSSFTVERLGAHHFGVSGRKK